MKATLEFNLDEIDEKDSHLRAVKADKAYNSLSEIGRFLRTLRKYGVPVHMQNKTQEELIEYIEEEFHKTVVNCGINLDEEWR